MADDGLGQLMAKAVDAAKRRSIELGDNYNSRLVPRKLK